MSLKDDLDSDVAGIFRALWTERDGQKVPEAEDVTLGSNDAVKLTATVLYADLADSTELVDGYQKTFAAEIYKSFLHCAAKIVREQGGTITAYDGDRIMAVYIGSAKNTSAVRSALKINFAMQEIVWPALRKQYGSETYIPKHVVGVDTSELLVARTGVRNANDLVWVGRAANYAAKLASLPESYATFITSTVYDVMNDVAKFSENGTGRNMWTELDWNHFDQNIVYASSWRWRVD
jgi:class 3 adenylate cyclase